MSNGRNKNKRGDSGRDAGGFMAVPWTVMDTPAYFALGYPARALLFEVARQFVRDNNGRLLASAGYLAPRGWNSRDVINRAKTELLAAGFLYETVKGHRPNKASWYAVTWRTLDRHAGYDEGAVECFVRSAYKNASLRPPGGQGTASIGPPGGQANQLARPAGGPIKPVLTPIPGPSGGHHLEMPSAVSKRAVSVL